MDINTSDLRLVGALLLPIVVALAVSPMHRKVLKGMFYIMSPRKRMM